MVSHALNYSVAFLLQKFGLRSCTDDTADTKLRFAFLELDMHFFLAGRLTGEGCYRDKMNDRAMPELLYNFRKTGELNWNDLTSSVIDKCKEAAQAKVIIAS